MSSVNNPSYLVLFSLLPLAIVIRATEEEELERVTSADSLALGKDT